MRNGVNLEVGSTSLRVPVINIPAVPCIVPARNVCKAILSRPGFLRSSNQKMLRDTLVCTLMSTKVEQPDVDISTVHIISARHDSYRTEE
jgi:hypothetical protein